MKSKRSLPKPTTKPRRKPSGRVTTKQRADAQVDVGRSLRRSTSTTTRRRGLQRLARDAEAPLERLAPPVKRAVRAATPKRRASPKQLKRKSRSAARQNKDAPRRG